MSDDRFVHRVRVRYSEVDMQGVVFNGHWLAYFDDAFTQFFGWLGFDPTTTFSGEFDVMLVHADIDWRGPAGFDDTVEIEVRPARLGRSSFDVRFEASVESRAVCEATITYVSIDADHAPAPIPQRLREAFGALV